MKWGKFVEGDLLNKQDLEKLFNEHDFDLVMHFSARSLVGESVVTPALYYENNVVGTFNLLEAMRKAGLNGVKNFVFSSTAAVYGYPETESITEDHPTKPINPYGQTKLMVEHMLEDYARAYGFNSVRLRYFNAAGADESGEIGEAHDPETHLIPNILKSDTGLKVFGDDYETRDGTCVRDYIHINDLCDAHLKAIDYLDTHEGSFVFNLGNGNGFSVKEVIESAEKVIESSIDYQVEDRRAGDPPTLIANSDKAREQLHWQPKYDSIQEVIRTAWEWHKVNDNG